MSCTPEAVVCDGNGSASDLGLLLEVGLGAALLALLLIALVLVLRRRCGRRGPVTRVFVSADGDVVQRRP